MKRRRIAMLTTDKGELTCSIKPKQNTEIPMSKRPLKMMNNWLSFFIQFEIKGEKITVAIEKAAKTAPTYPG